MIVYFRKYYTKKGISKHHKQYFPCNMLFLPTFVLTLRQKCDILLPWQSFVIYSFRFQRQNTNCQSSFAAQIFKHSSCSQVFLGGLLQLNSTCQIHRANKMCLHLSIKLVKSFQSPSQKKITWRKEADKNIQCEETVENKLCNSFKYE